MHESDVRMSRRDALRTAALIGLALIGAPMLGTIEGCVTAREPRPIVYGRDECTFCRMVVSEPRYAAAMVTAKGRTLVFDSVECLASYCVRNPLEANRARALRVSVDASLGELFPAEQAYFARVVDGSSPMGKGITAVRARADASELPANTPLVRWPELLQLVQREGLQRGAGPQSTRGS